MENFEKNCLFLKKVSKAEGGNLKQQVRCWCYSSVCRVCHSPSMIAGETRSTSKHIPSISVNLFRKSIAFCKALSPKCSIEYCWKHDLELVEANGVMTWTDATQYSFSFKYTPTTLPLGHFPWQWILLLKPGNAPFSPWSHISPASNGRLIKHSSAVRLESNVVAPVSSWKLKRYFWPWKI